MKSFHSVPKLRCVSCHKYKGLANFYTTREVFPNLFNANQLYGCCCKDCHAMGRLKYGYGWYGSDFISPHRTGFGVL